MNEQTLLNITHWIMVTAMAVTLALLCVEAIIQRRYSITQEKLSTLKLRYIAILSSIIAIIGFFGRWYISNEILVKSNFELAQLSVYLSDTTTSNKQEYIMKLTNDSLVDSSTYEFDIMIKSNHNTFRLKVYQCGLRFDFAALSPKSEKLFFSYLEGTSALNNKPYKVGIESYDEIQLLTFISLMGDDEINDQEIRVGRFRLKSSGSFKGIDPKISWDFSNAIGTKLIKAPFLVITNPQNHINLISKIIGPEIVANLKINLEGVYENGSMRTTLNDKLLIPLLQPYNIPPYNYFGDEKVNHVPNDVVDWVLLELRRDINANTRIATKAAFIKKNGIIVDLDGNRKVSFNNIHSDKYYVVIKHRNHLSIMSSNPILLTTNSDIYDFTTDQNKAYGFEAMANLGINFGMYSGDGDYNDVINVLDYAPIGNSLFYIGYNAADLDMNGIVNILDYIKTNNNLLRKSQVKN